MSPCIISDIDRTAPELDGCETLFGVVPQRQPDGKTCVQNCIAMALGIPVRKVIERYGDRSMNQTELIRILIECNFVWNQMVTGALVHQGWYFAAVPSLNRVGGMHEVLLHYSQEDGLLVVDPAIGEQYKQDGSDLKSWADLTPFWLRGRLPNA